MLGHLYAQRKPKLGGIHKGLMDASQINHSLHHDGSSIGHVYDSVTIVSWVETSSFWYNFVEYFINGSHNTHKKSFCELITDCKFQKGKFGRMFFFIHSTSKETCTGCVLSCVSLVWYRSNLLISCRITSLTPRQFHDCPIIIEATLQYMDRLLIRMHNYKKMRHIRVHI